MLLPPTTRLWLASKERNLQLAESLAAIGFRLQPFLRAEFGLRSELSQDGRGRGNRWVGPLHVRPVVGALRVMRWYERGGTETRIDTLEHSEFRVSTPLL